MDNIARFYLDDFKFKLSVIDKYLKEKEIVQLEDITFIAHENVILIKNEDLVLILSRNKEKVILFLYELKEDKKFKEINENITSFIENNKLILKLTKEDDFEIKEYLFYLKELVIPIFSYFISSVLEKNNIDYPSIFPEIMSTPEYQINYINNKYNLTREQSLTYLFGSPKINDNGIIFETDVFVENLEYKEIAEDDIMYYFDTYIFDEDIKVLRKDWFVVLDELKLLLKNNNKLARFRDISHKDALEILENNFKNVKII